jgi:23S rRNA pseudouridine2457 synthase
MRVKPRIILFNKPYGVLCQFRTSGDRPTLGDFIDVPGVYAAGRLDATSEGLLLLTDDGRLQHRISDPRHKVEKVYWAQVEGVPDATAVDALRRGVVLDGRKTLPAKVRSMAEPDSLWPRDPPIRYRKNIPEGWLEIRIREGRNRQVRRMTAVVGHPTLRLIRYAVGPYTLDGLVPGAWRDAEDLTKGLQAENAGRRSLS